MEKKNKTEFAGVLMLLLTAVIWGSSFVSQKVGSESVSPFTFMGIRTILGASVLVPFILIRDKINSKKMSASEIAARKCSDKKAVFYGAVIGVLLAIATNFQQFAFDGPDASAGKIAFITAMYMFFVPIFTLFTGKKIGLVTWICILMGFFGLYLLCFKGGEGFSVTKSDLLAFVCAIFFTLQILAIEKYAPNCDGIKLSCAQFFSAGIITVILMFIFEKPDLSVILKAKSPILYSGIMSCGIAYTLQVVGQKKCEATIATLLMCMESVFACLSEALILNRHLSGREISGCIIMFSAILISQIVPMLKKNHDQK